MGKIVIIHFSPPELYPPVQNLINVLSPRISKEANILLITNNTNQALHPYDAPLNITVKRIALSGNKLSALVRYWNFIKFYSLAIFWLVKLRPQKILYFESISAFPCVIYKILIDFKVQLFIHYHEYISALEYKKGPILNRLFHSLEKKIYSTAKWVSHTNEQRLALFKKDIYPINLPGGSVFPNHPPLSWKKTPWTKVHTPVRFVYAGACSLDTMYLAEFALWINSQNGDAILEIYAYNISQDAEAFLMKLKSKWVRLNKGIAYESLPDMIADCDIGVILYKGHIPNYVYNAPNKLFEYLVCGLDVWYPIEMIGCDTLRSVDYWPKVISVDFKDLQNLNYSSMIIRSPGYERKVEFNSEATCQLLVNQLLD